MTFPLQTEQSALQMASLCSIFDCFSWGLSPAHCQVSFRRRCFVVRPSREDRSAGGGLQRYLVWSRNAVGIFHAYILQEQSCSCSPSPYPVPLPLSLQSGVSQVVMLPRVPVPPKLCCYMDTRREEKQARGQDGTCCISVAEKSKQLSGSTPHNTLFLRDFIAALLSLPVPSPQTNWRNAPASAS